MRMKREAEETCLLGGSAAVVVGLEEAGDLVDFDDVGEDEDGEVGEMAREMELVEGAAEIEESKNEESEEKRKPENTRCTDCKQRRDWESMGAEAEDWESGVAARRHTQLAKGLAPVCV
jgi:hypothetical protein